MSKPTRPATQQSECRSCHAPILWTITSPGGKAMPVDADATLEGKFIVNHRPHENKLIAIHLSHVADDALPGRKRYRSHFESCPDRDKHRKAKR